LRGAVFQTHQLRLALRAGEISRVARAVAFEAAYSSAGGTRNRRRTAELLGITADLASRVETPYVRALPTLIGGWAAYLEGDWKAGARGSEESAAMLKRSCTGVAWELDTSQFFLTWCHYYMGEFRLLVERYPALLKDAQDRGDLYALTQVRIWLGHHVHLMNDDPVRADLESREAMNQWSQRDFSIQHFWMMWAEVDGCLYTNRGLKALQIMTELWPALRSSGLLTIQEVRLQSLEFLGRCLLGAARESGEAVRRAFLRRCLRVARRMERDGAAWGAALAGLLRAGVSSALGKRRGSERLLAAAEERFREIDMASFAEVSRRRRGQQVGGPDGLALVQATDAWMRDQGVVRPDLMADMFTPGHWEPVERGRETGPPANQPNLEASSTSR
jgi:eukaryotic-like serine/threonine-protein kinase